ncbi:MAG: HlyD family type I secretion periplasmic adaptor subunit [Alphaproteobacteria bacterium]|nr:HlyD family type I secretion periplasmic adaptor subunit [Alphaproteobacteria bacterium]
MFRFKEIQEKQKRFLAQATQLEETGNPLAVRLTLYGISALILAFVAWAGVTNINEVARAPGSVTPQGYEQVVQHLEGGIIKEIKVAEGQTVEKGDTLIVLDGAGAEDDLARLYIKQAALEMQEERMRAFIEGRIPAFTSISAEAATMVKDQQMMFDNMRKDRDEEKRVLQDQLVQKEYMITTLAGDLNTAQRNYAIIADLHKRRSDLHKRGFTSDVQLLETKQRLNDIEGEISRTKSKMEIARAERQELNTRIKSLDANQHDEAYERLDSIMSEKMQNAELIAKQKDRVKRLAVSAPAKGIVKGLSVHTIGAVVQPGQMLLEIVPLDQPMIAEIRIPPQHIGHVRQGQEVHVKFSSFDFARYGFATGKLQHISATTFSGENGERFYEGRVNLDKQYVGRSAENAMMPGMTVMADIVTGNKTILQYLLKPVHTAMLTAFTER